MDCVASSEQALISDTVMFDQMINFCFTKLFSPSMPGYNVGDVGKLLKEPKKCWGTLAKD